MMGRIPHAISAVGFTVVGGFIAAQRDTDGGPLTGDYHGLLIALVICLAFAFWSAMRCVGLRIVIEE